MGTGAVDPLEKIHDPAPRIKRWEQGVAAVFAGFVAAHQHSGVATTIAEFSKTDQWGMILPTLRELHASSAASASPEGQAQDQLQDEHLKVVLAKTLHGSNNKFVRPSPKSPSNPHTSEPEAAVVWELTSVGKKNFAIGPIAAMGTSAVRHGVGAGVTGSQGSAVGVSTWWNA